MFLERKVKIILHGYLKKLYPHNLEMSGFCVSDIINGMCKMTKAFDPKPGSEKHVISVLGFDCHEALNAPISENLKELHITPAFIGGKSGAFTRIAIGAVLIAAAFFTGGASLAAGPVLFGAGATATTLAGVMFNVGLAIALGGLLELISPQPKADTFGNSASDPEASKYLSASQNTVKIGTRIPLAYGRVKAYGHYISFDVDAVDVAA